MYDIQPNYHMYRSLKKTFWNLHLMFHIQPNYHTFMSIYKMVSELSSSFEGWCAYSSDKNSCGHERPFPSLATL